MKEFEARNHGRFENKSVIEIWGYNHFREYLLALGRDKKFAEPINNFPNEIELSREWHDTLNQMRSDTADGRERFIFVATDKGNQNILLPTKSMVGSKNFVPSKVIDEHYNWGESKNVEEYVGSIHSHPRDYLGSLVQLYKKLNFCGNFSIGDLYSLLTEEREDVSGLVEDEDNLFAFKTLQTKKTDFKYLPGRKGIKKFENYWCSFNNFNIVKGNVYRQDGRLINLSDVWKLESSIAEKHKLVIYRGRPDALLKRYYPPITDNKLIYLFNRH